MSTGNPYDVSLAEYFALERGGIKIPTIAAPPAATYAEDVLGLSSGLEVEAMWLKPRSG